MEQSVENKDERINLRLKRRAKQLLEHAASVEGQTVSKFVLSSALARAEQTVREHDVLSLQARDAETFFAALAQPVAFNDELVAALAEHDRRVQSK